MELYPVKSQTVSQNRGKKKRVVCALAYHSNYNYTT